MFVQISSEPVDPPKQHKIIVIQPDRFELAHLIGNGSCGEVHKVCTYCAIVNQATTSFPGLLAHRC